MCVRMFDEWWQMFTLTHLFHIHVKYIFSLLFYFIYSFVCLFTVNWFVYLFLLVIFRMFARRSSTCWFWTCGTIENTSSSNTSNAFFQQCKHSTQWEPSYQFESWKRQRPWFESSFRRSRRSWCKKWDCTRHS
jgi:hypothetical protein